MSDWIRQFKFDPIPGLVNSENKPISYFARRDVLGERVEPVGNLWKLSEAQKIVDRQRARFTDLLSSLDSLPTGVHLARFGRKKSVTVVPE